MVNTEGNTIEGLAVHWNDEKLYGLIVARTGVRYFVHYESIVPDTLQRRFLLKGERVMFRPVIHKGRNRAYDVQPLDRPAVDVPDDYHEQVRLLKWNGTIGFARRPCDFCFHP